MTITILWHVETCSDVVKHVHDGGDACVIGGMGIGGGGLHACLPVNKIGLHRTVQAIPWGFVGNLEGGRY